MRKSFAILMTMIAALFGVSAFGQVKINPLNIKERTLANGLKVVSLQDNASPTVAIHVWYNVGSKDDPQGRSGFAHMFEHMMFKSTKNMPNEKMDRLTEDVGGFNNASTYDDFTNYYEVVPSNYLETLLWAESDRMVNLNVDEANFNSERDVVKEEFRQRILANPYGMLFGQYLEKLFGRLAKPTGTIPRVTAVEPERTVEQRHITTAPNVPFPAVAITYLAPNSKSPDVAALRIAEKILSAGESSRLYQSLVYKQQIAQQAGFTADIRVDRGLLYLLAIASQGKTADMLEKSLLAELKAIQTTRVTTGELAKAKNQLITEAIQSREDNDGKAIVIERAVAYESDPKAVNSDIQELQAVTAADVQRVMKKYFTDTNRVVIHYQQGEQK